MSLSLSLNIDIAYNNNKKTNKNSLQTECITHINTQGGIRKQLGTGLD